MTFLKLTMTDGAKEQKVFINPYNVTWVQRVEPKAVPSPDEGVADSAGAIIHMVGDPTLHVTVTESAEVVARALEEAC